MVCGIRFFRPFGAPHLSLAYPRLAPWALFFSPLRGSLPFLSTSPLRPERAIQRPVLDGFGDVFRLNGRGAFEVGDRSGYL